MKQLTNEAMGKARKDSASKEAPMSRCFDAANLFDVLVPWSQIKRERRALRSAETKRRKGK